MIGVPVLEERPFLNLPAFRCTGDQNEKRFSMNILNEDLSIFRCIAPRWSKGKGCLRSAFNMEISSDRPGGP